MSPQKRKTNSKGERKRCTPTNANNETWGNENKETKADKRK